MSDKHFVWDEVYEGLVLSGPSKAEDEKKKDQRRKSKTLEAKIYCPHKRLIFTFKETLNFTEQTKFRKLYQRKLCTDENSSCISSNVVLLQDIKDLALYLLTSPISIEFIGFIHLDIVDRFLRALILYMQHYLTTWCELNEKRAATAKRASNPLAGGARVQRSEEMRVLRCVLAREYVDLLMGCQPDAKRYHHANAGEMLQSQGEKDIRVFEGLIQFAHRVVWIALERKHKELIELEIHRLFRTEAFNTAKRKFGKNSKEMYVPDDESWILYGPKMPRRRKILRNSPLPYEVLCTDCDYRTLCLGLVNVKSQDPQIVYLKNALLAKEEDLPQLGIKIGILGLPRADFDLLLIPHASDDDQMIVDDTPTDKAEGADDYETLMPPGGSNIELIPSFPLEKYIAERVGDEKLRKDSKTKWIKRELKRANLNYA